MAMFSVKSRGPASAVERRTEVAIATIAPKAITGTIAIAEATEAPKAITGTIAIAQATEATKAIARAIAIAQATKATKAAVIIAVVVAHCVWVLGLGVLLENESH